MEVLTNLIVGIISQYICVSVIILCMLKLHMLYVSNSSIYKDGKRTLPGESIYSCN